jgi:secondary thiamine-phosphate synthase enzyme
VSQTIPQTHTTTLPSDALTGIFKVRTKVLSIQTAERLELVDLSEAVRSFADTTGITEGQAHVSSLHTTAGLFINEWQEALLADMKDAIARLVPQNTYYRHNDSALSDCDRGNGDSHLRNMVIGQSVTVPLAHGGLVLGRWQRVILAEFDGPSERQVFVQVLGI